ncbi:MAG: ribose-phosphate diphosphokinase [Burkholderiales bacterium]|nr:MAG: ribose-phosphate diphosphokinase [Burkholderiales bacterium]
MTEALRPVLLHFADQEAPARRLADAAGLSCAPIETRRFPDGETLLRLPVPLASRSVLFCSLGAPDARLVEVLLASRAAREHGVAHLTLVAPYLCYMRQDMAFRPGEAVSQRIIGGFLGGLFDAVITVDPHLHRIDRLDEAVTGGALAVSLTAAAAIGAFLAGSVPDAILVGPDEESAQWVAAVAAHARRPFAVFTKTRHGDREVDVVAEGGAPVAGAPVVLIDDIASSGRTLAQAARVCLAAGATRVDAFVTHALCAEADLQALRAAGVGRLWSTDALAHPSNAVPLAPLLAAGLRAHGLA